jgi:hypothetical protein
MMLIYQSFFLNDRCLKWEMNVILPDQRRVRAARRIHFERDPVRNISNKQSVKPSILRNPFKILKYSNFFTFFNRIKYVVLEIYRVALFALSTIKSQKKRSLASCYILILLI